MFKRLGQRRAGRISAARNPYNNIRFRRIYQVLADLVIASRPRRLPPEQPRLDALRLQHAYWAIEAILLADPDDAKIQGVIADLARMAPTDRPWSISRLDTERLWLDCLFALRQRGDV
ncbi:hypothetical protein [Pseudomonas coronafaciens]|uniref:hypothetical protein n=1 Tax=Pseudomonas coronafaciens TaxID=53409 RepID=UPI000EFEF650|nr:hypothetical protein [Pseudomonas coronafaciens]RMV68034.1 hypothetical protein ALP06_04002 [Pseudomonas coronafaciens pv. atropurpurea]